MKTYAFRLRPGQDLKRSLMAFVMQHHLQAACVLTCVGSLQRAALRYADQSETTFTDGKFEIVSLVGTLCPDGAHVHIALSDSRGGMIGGHLQDGALIYTTAEIVLGELEGVRFSRQQDDESGWRELVIEDLD